MKFQIEQIALSPVDVPRAKALLADLGIEDWVEDTVVARGEVFGRAGCNQANLAFNYDSRPDKIELELLHYATGDNWVAGRGPVVSHLGMHCTAAELQAYREIFRKNEIAVAQEVYTESHTNPYLLQTGRKYQYVIFQTRHILGVDLKFIVRREAQGAQ